MSGISYGDARAGNVKYIADGFELTEDDALPVTITATLGASSAVSGSDVLIVAKTVVKIKLEVAAQELRPLGDVDNKKNPNFNKDGPDKRKVIADFSKVKKTTVTVKVTDGQDAPLQNYSFTIQALTRSQSGGHDHTADRPSGKFVTSAGDTSVSLQGTTDENGIATYTYLSSGFGGIDSIGVKGEDEQQTATATIVLRMGGLQLLADGEHYNLIGAYGEDGVTSRHTVNHHGTSNLIGKLKALADSVYADSSFVLRINDMSIVNGGPFDTGNNWNTPHQNHREGISVDIDDVDASGKAINT